MNFTFTFFLGLVKVEDTSTFLGFAYMQDLVLWFTAASDRAAIRKDAKRHCVSVHGRLLRDLGFPRKRGEYIV